MENVDLIEKLNSAIAESSQAHTDGIAAYETAAKLQQISTTLLNEMKSQYGVDDKEYEKIIDKCAARIIECSMDSYNLFAKEVEKGDVARFKEYLPRIKDLLMSINVKALSSNLKEKVFQQRAKISDVIDYEDDYIRHMQHICYYCGKNKAVESASCKQNLYSLLDRQLNIAGSSVTYLKTSYLSIDRCEKCKSIHYKRDSLAWILGVIVCLITTLLFVKYILPDGYVFGVLLGVFIGFVSYKLFFLLFKNSSVKNKKDIKEYPEVRHMLEKGWSTEEPIP